MLKRNLQITLEQARSLYKSNPKLKEMLLNSFTIEELERKEIRCWEDLEEIDGWFIAADSEINPISISPTIRDNQNLFKTKEQALSCLAKAQLSQLLAEYNGDWNPNWSDGDNLVYTIEKFKNKLCVESYFYYNNFLAFETKEKAEKFLELHRELIKQYCGDI